MAGTIGDQLRNSRIGYPKAKEVWHVNDGAIRLSDDGRKPKRYRPCLVMADTMIISAQYRCVNVLPLSRSGPKTNLALPCFEYSYLVKQRGWEPSTKSKAIVPFYQPIKIDHFEFKLGTIQEDCYETIMDVLCGQVIGHVCSTANFDLELD